MNTVKVKTLWQSLAAQGSYMGEQDLNTNDEAAQAAIPSTVQSPVKLKQYDG